MEYLQMKKLTSIFYRVPSVVPFDTKYRAKYTLYGKEPGKTFEDFE
jgi:hypothetical protein